MYRRMLPTVTIVSLIIIADLDLKFALGILVMILRINLTSFIGWYFHALFNLFSILAFVSFGVS